METKKESYESPSSRILKFEHQGIVCQTNVEDPDSDPDYGEW